MKPRFFGLLVLAMTGCATSSGRSYEAVEREYVIGFLQRNPVVSTYLGGVGLDPSLADIDSKLRDWSPAALEAEDRWLEAIDGEIAAIDPARLASNKRIDRSIARAQIAFLLRQHRTRRLQERSIDTYVLEPFRGIEFQLQGMTATSTSRRGTTAEWRRVAERLHATPKYFEAAKIQLRAGLASGNTPDSRMIERNGLGGIAPSAEYLAEDLPKQASQDLPGAPELVEEVRAAAKEAALAYRSFGQMLLETYYLPDGKTLKPELAGDRYAIGEKEYDWALSNNLGLKIGAAQLYEESLPIIEATRKEMVALARRIGAEKNLSLPADDAEALARLREFLEQEHPKSDQEMLAWYRDCSSRMVEYARRTGLFDVPENYQLEVAAMPAALRSGGPGAAYYPAPPFKGTGVGRFYVTTSNGDPKVLEGVSRAGVASLSAHEGFPGHDWHYKVMSASSIAPIRWLTPGAIEDSSSMWQDSLAAEGWGLYAEALMAEPMPGAPEGFYSPEERYYMLRAQLFREVRVRIDTGLHLGRITYDEAIEIFSTLLSFREGSCKEAKDPAKKRACFFGEHEIYRYSKWPTQAVTYRLGRDALQDLRSKAERALGPRFNLKTFHLAFMQQGSIPPAAFADELLRVLEKSP